MIEKVNMRYLIQLAESFPTISAASTEIINLQAILNLPKGTEHFLSDVHGEYEAFSHVIRSGSGAVRKKIEEVFGHTLKTSEKGELATLIYYPSERICQAKETTEDMLNWYRVSLYRLIEVCKRVSSKYTRSKVRKALPKDYAYVIEELITEKPEVLDKESYYEAIVHTILEIGCAERLIVAMARLISRLVIDNLHVIGDIFDRGPGPHHIMDMLCDYHSVDIQWGNHDVLWMGAACGIPACIANVIRISLRYANLGILEDGYGINMMPLATFAMTEYADDPCSCFAIKGAEGLDDTETRLAMKMHKAITVLQFKLEGAIIRRRSDFHMDDRLLLDKIDVKAGTVTIGGKSYKMEDVHFPTIDWKDPYKLTKREEEVMERLSFGFTNCDKLQRHVMLLLKKGNLYKVCNGNLLFHGCVPLEGDGKLKPVWVLDGYYAGRELYDVLESHVRRAYYALDGEERDRSMDMVWYLWEGPDSPLFGKDKMTTFERYFIKDPHTHKENKNPYYKLLEDDKTVDRILAAFGLSQEGVHIINGHVPVHQSEGESPVKCGGKVLVIDGGFSKAYHATTGIAGYTLTYNSYGLNLVALEPFVSAKRAIREDRDMVSRQVAVEVRKVRMRVGDTDNGRGIEHKIADLKELILAYRTGKIVEQK